MHTALLASSNELWQMREHASFGPAGPQHFARKRVDGRTGPSGWLHLPGRSGHGVESADVESEWLFERSVSAPGLHVLDLGLSESTSQAANGTVTFGCLYSTYEPVA